MLPDGTRLSGQLCIGEKRVYARITEAVTSTGDTFTVCMELVEQFGGKRGLEIEPDGGVILRLGEQPQPPGTNHHPRHEIADDRPQPEPLEEGDGDDPAPRRMSAC